MTTSKRRFYRDSYIHVYQRSADRGVIFFSTYDLLVYITILSIVAAKYNITIIALCPMPDHVHILLRAGSEKDLSRFIQDYSHLFAQVYNQDCSRKGSLFEARFGRATKSGGKYIRTSISYVFNNPVEKQLTAKALSWKWNLLAYGASPNPFSEKIKKEKASSRLRRAINTVSDIHNQGKYLTYQLLRRIFSPLGSAEKKQLVDFILKTYSPIDYEELVSWYKDYPSMILAIESNTGSEYDIKEEYDPGSDAVYLEMAKYMSATFPNVKEVRELSIDEKLRHWKDLSKRFHASPKHLSRFLHLPLLTS